MRPTLHQELILAVGRWIQSRGGPRKEERDAEIALEKVAREYFGLGC